MSAGYKTFHCRYRYSSRGGWSDYDCIVTAEIESKALGMALMAYPDTEARNWSAEEIDLSKEGVYEMTAYCN